MTISELKKHCEDQIKMGNGDKKILLSNDDEGNGYHQMFYAFTTIEQMKAGVDENDPMADWITGYIDDAITKGDNILDYIVLG